LNPAGDPWELLERLAEGVHRALPADAAAVEVERDRSLADRLSGRPGRVSMVRVTRADTAMTLRWDGRRLIGESARVVGGVVIARSAVPVGAWLTMLTGQVAALAADLAGDASAASAALAALGIQPAGSDLAVSEHDLEGGLRALTGRAAGRLPAAGAEAVQRIVGLLLDTLPRVSGRGEQEVLVRRTATNYLPETLRAYVALPADWAASHRLSNGLTASDTLMAQLTDLESAAQRMRDAAVGDDAQALLVNGRFLSDRFAISSLDLPN
jgi:hypothetical protein